MARWDRTRVLPPGMLAIWLKYIVHCIFFFWSEHVPDVDSRVTTEESRISLRCQIQKSECSLVAQRVKSLLAKPGTRAWPLSQEDLLEKGMPTLSSVLAWQVHGQGSWCAPVHGVTKRQTQLWATDNFIFWNSFLWATFRAPLTYFP